MHTRFTSKNVIDFSDIYLDGEFFITREKNNNPMKKITTINIFRAIKNCDN